MKGLLIRGVVLLGVMLLANASFFARRMQAQTSGKQPAAENPIHNMEMPGLSEKHRWLNTLVGNWTITGHTNKGCPYGEGKFTAREHNELMKGGKFLVSRTQYSSLFKNSNQIAFFGVDPATQQYTYAMYSNLGVIVQATGEVRDKAKASLVGNAIEWTEKKVNVDMHGAQPTMVYTTEVISPNEYRFSLKAGGTIWYEGLAKREQVINPGP
jgi:uncharacterized protein DUF1579